MGGGEEDGCSRLRVNVLGNMTHLERYFLQTGVLPVAGEGGTSGSPKRRPSLSPAPHLDCDMTLEIVSAPSSQRQGDNEKFSMIDACFTLRLC